VNVLAIGAHFDDVELGCSGSLVKHVNRGDNVTVYTATHSGYSAPDGRMVRSPEDARREGEKAALILGVDLICGGWETNQLTLNDPLVCSVLEIVEAKNIDTIYTHWVDDAHQDHQALAKASIAAGKHVSRILMYQSNMYDGSASFRGDFYVDISDVIETKKKAICAHVTELQRVDGRWLEVFMKKCAVDGYRIGVEFAEVFQIIKYLAPI